MKEFNFDYDEKYDDLFVFEKGKKSDGGIEIGDFVFDFTKNGEFVSFEIQNAKENLKGIAQQDYIDLTKLKSCRVNINKIKDFLIINMNFIFDNSTIQSNIIIPSIKEKNKVLCY
jgi:hypothetical protein